MARIVSGRGWPRFMKLIGEHYEGNDVILTVKVRKWHPSFWWFVIREMIWQ